MAGYPKERGEMTINGHKMAWVMTRSRNESAFGVRGSRIFALELTKDDAASGTYEKGWVKGIDKDDEETALCLSYLVDRFGRETPKKKKEMGSTT